MEDGKRLTVVIADDDPLVRRLIRDRLQEGGVVVAAEAGNGREAVELALHYRPDVVLMDVIMPGQDGIDATKVLVERAPEVKVVMLTMSDDQEIALLGLRAGATGYLSKDVDLATLPEVLRGVVAGGVAIDPDLTKLLVERLRQTPEGGLGTRPVKSPLTSREWEVLDRMTAGLTIDDIAQEFVIAHETVRSHVKNILKKLNVHSQAEAVAVARQMRGS